jgi:hypothetical protein
MDFREMNFSFSNKYVRLAVSIVLSIIGCFTVKAIWISAHQPEPAPHIRLLALWLPLQYIAFAIYYFYVELRLGQTDPLKTALRQDGYTHLGWLIVFGLVIGYQDIGPFEFWFAVAYFTILIVKLLIVILFWLDGRPPPKDKSSKTFPRGLDIFIVLFFLYFFISPWVDKASPPEGDEPYFLLLTHSMLYDHDINLSNNFANKDYLKFSPLITHDLAPQPHDIVIPGYYRSHHFPLFPAMLIPGYAIAGRIGVIWEMNLLAALLMAILYKLSCQLIKSRKGALLGTICVAFSSPIVVYAGLAYREIPVALLLMMLLYQARQIYTKEKEQWYSLPFLILILVLLGPRYAIPAIPFIAYLLYSVWRDHGENRIIIFALVIASIFVALTGYYLFFQESFLTELFNGDFVNGRTFLSNFFGLFFDQQWGIFFVAPIYLLAVFGFVTFYRRSNKEAFLLLFMCVPYIVFISDFVNAFGWASPAPRYLVCILPLAGIFLSAFFSMELPSFFIYLAALLGLFSGIISWIYILLPSLRESLYYSMKNQIFREVGIRVHADLGRFFPSFLRWNEAGTIFPILGIVAIIVLIYFYICSCRKKVRQQIIFQPLYFSFLSLGVVSLVLNGAIYAPIHIIDPEDTEITYTDVGRHYPPFEKVLSDFQNNEENFGLSMSADGFIASYGRIPRGMEEITLLSKANLIHGQYPFVRVNIGPEDFGQSEIVDSTKWVQNTFIGENDLSPALFQMSFLNYCRDTVLESDRSLDVNKFIFEPSQLRIHPVYHSGGESEISFAGTIPRTTKAVSFKMQNPPGDYILHADLRPEFKERYDPYFGLKLNGNYLGRINRGNVSDASSTDYWVHLDSNQQDLQMIFSENIFIDSPLNRVPCPVNKLSFMPLPKTDYGAGTQNIYLFQFSQQILSGWNSNSITFFVPGKAVPMIGILWAKLESAKSPVQLEIKNSHHQTIGNALVSTSDWSPSYFTTESIKNNESLTLSLSDSTPKDIMNGGPYVYLHKLYLFPDTPLNRERMKKSMEANHG